MDLNSTYTQVASSSSGYAQKNPKTEGWYEQTDGGLYFLSEKTSTATGTFFTKA